MSKREDDLKYRRSIGGLITKIYNHQKEKSIKRGHQHPKYTKEEFIDWILNTNFVELHHKWVESDYNKCKVPSVDRLDDNRGYSLDNIRVVTWQENNSKNHNGRITGESRGNMTEVWMLTEDGRRIRNYRSIAEASRHILDKGNGKNLNSIKAGIGKVIRGRENRTTAFGYKWEYGNE